MKYFLIFVALISLSFQNSKKGRYNSVEQIDSIIAYSINFNTSFVKAADCENFAAYSPEKIMLTSYKDRVMQDLAFKITDEDKKGWFIDTRAKIEIYYHNRKADTICLGNLPVISVNGNSYGMPYGDLAYLIDSLYAEIAYKDNK